MAEPAKQQIDFSPLASISGKSKSKNTFIYLAMFSFFLYFIVLQIESLYFLLILLPFLMIGFIVAAFVSHFAHRRRTSEAISAFAQKNGLTYLKEERGNIAKNGTVFSQGHSRRRNNIISGQFNSLPYETYSFTYVIGSGKSQRTVDLQVFELTLPRVLPHMVIDSLVEYGNEQGSTLPISFDSSQKIELEGDFHKYFALYAPDKYGISALTVLAPDAMEALMKYAALCDIEIIDNKIYFYWPDPAMSQNQFTNMFATVQGVMTKIQAKLVRGDIFSTQDQKQVHAQASARGARLKTSRLATIFSIVIFVIFFGARIGLEILPPSFTLGFAGFMIIFALVSVLYAGYKDNKSARLRKDLAIRNRTIGTTS